jgi:aryl-phospho-beta-D-glucosidase BglC (GH1 family)
VSTPSLPHRTLRRRRTALVVACALAVAAVTPACVATPGRESEEVGHIGTTVPEARAARLARGVNLSHWFAGAYGDAPRLDVDSGFTTVEDLRKIRALGFRHVRLPVAPEPMCHESDPERIEGPALDALDRALDAIAAESLAVIIDLHPAQGGPFKKRLADDDAHVRTVARFWRALARHLATRDPEMVFLEVMNESEVKDRARWSAVQRTLLAAMREGAPGHTLIATGARWGSVRDLALLEPVRDRNVVYDFHFYDPYEFTHQGATWAVDRWSHLRSLPYPSSVERVVPTLGMIGTASAKMTALKYGTKGWDAELLAERLEAVSGWADRHGVRVMCGEFGAYRAGAPAADRARWLRDVRTLLERSRIGWSVWDYASAGFGIVDPKSGEARRPDPAVVRALGLE